MEEPTTKFRSKNKQRLLAAAVCLVLIAVAVLFTLWFSREPNEVVHTSPDPKVVQVLITPDGFVPASVTVERGSVVEWISEDSSTTHVVQSNPYPSGKDMPDLNSDQLGAGATYRFKFAEAGEYAYHDKLNPTMNATVIVR